MSEEPARKGTTLVIRRVFAAPVERVWRAWTDPVQMARWFHPNETWSCAKVEMDPTTGGHFNVTMRHKDGDEFDFTGKYLDVIDNERFSLHWHWDPTGPSSGDQFIRVEFRSVPEGTELTLTDTKVSDPEERNNTREGWGGCFNFLAEVLAADGPGGT